MGLEYEPIYRQSMMVRLGECRLRSWSTYEDICLNELRQQELRLRSWESVVFVVVPEVVGEWIVEAEDFGLDD